MEIRTNMVILVNKRSKMEKIQRIRRDVPDIISLFFLSLPYALLKVRIQI